MLKLLDFPNATRFPFQVIATTGYGVVGNGGPSSSNSTRPPDTLGFGMKIPLEVMVRPPPWMSPPSRVPRSWLPTTLLTETLEFDIDKS